MGNERKRIELFCEGCPNRGKCEEPCAEWYDELADEMFGNGNTIKQ